MLRRNLFIGISNGKLEECYKSYVRVTCKRENENELFSELVTEYKTFVDSQHPNAAKAICQSDMFNEIAKKYFRIVDIVKNKDFCDLLGIEVKDIG